jgi:hypothetical protein
VIPRLRQSPQGVVAVRDERRYGLSNRPWSVIHVPDGVNRHYMSQALTDQAVAGWAVLEARQAVAP